MRASSGRLMEPFEFWPVGLCGMVAVSSPHTLRRADFSQGVDGVLLHGYIRGHDRVGEHDVAGAEDVNPLPYPRSPT